MTASFGWKSYFVAPAAKTRASVAAKSSGQARAASVVRRSLVVEVAPPRDLHIFHVMIARQKHLDRMGETQ
ncbi:MAG: hypothetical protein WKF73_10990 [Nocardioidaceae bacterium]